MSVQIQEIDEFLVDRKHVDLKQKLAEIVSFAGALTVDSEISFRQISALYAESKDWEKKIEFIRKQANEPDQERIAARNDKAKELLNPLKEIQSIAKSKSGQYQVMLEDAKRRDEERIRQAVDILGLDDVPYFPPAEKSVRTEKAMMITRTVREFRIVDQALVPARYLKVDTDAIERDIKLGIANIPGIEITEKQITQLRTR